MSNLLPGVAHTWECDWDAAHHSGYTSLIDSDPSEPEGPSLPFGFVRHRELATTREQLPEPWMWWH